MNKKQERTSKNDRDSSDLHLRKVRSMGSVDVFNDEQKKLRKPQEWSSQNSTSPCSPRTNSRKLASKFSAGGSVRCMTMLTPCVNANETIFPSQVSDHQFRASSSSSLLQATSEDTADELGANLLNRGIIVGYFSVICLLIVTLKIHYDKNSSPRLHGAAQSSQKLGAAAIGSLTTVFSPILPFTGGADLRRGEYSLTELLPTGSFETWDSVYLLGKDFATKRLSNKAGDGSISSRIPRGGAQTSGKKQRLASKKQIEAKKIVVSASDSFLHLDEIGKMTLTDLSILMNYAINVNREGFDEMAFYSSLSTRMRNSIRAVDLACSKSRGKDVLPARTISNSREERRFGNIDALQYSAFMRVFAEWRLLRQVPEGYKGYAVGMGLGHKDVLQNLVKVESAIFAWIEERREMIKAEKKRLEKIKEDCESGAAPINITAPNNCYVDIDSEALVLRSPTLYELLKDEVEFDVHNGKLPRLKEKSAAMGLLWVRRQFNYQASVFTNVQSGKFSDVPSAVGAAYMDVYDKYHGWAVQKIFNYSFKAAPSAEEIYQVMNPKYLEEVLETAKSLPNPNNDVENVPKSNEYDRPKNIPTKEVESPTKHNLHDQLKGETIDVVDENVVVVFSPKQNPFERIGQFIVTEWEKIGEHINGEIEKLVRQWEKLAAHTLGIFGVKIEEKPFSTKTDKGFGSKFNRKEGKDNIRGGQSDSNKNKGLQGKHLEEYINKRLTEQAHKEMQIFSEIAQPLIEDLDELFEELNMNDPTRV